MSNDSKVLLIKTIQKEDRLRKKNDFLFLKVIQQRLEVKTVLPSKINDVEVSTVNQLLIKKLLEYRQVRNFNREEENLENRNVEILNENLTLLKRKSYETLGNIMRKQEEVVYCCVHPEFNTNISTLRVLQKLTTQHFQLLTKLCEVISVKHHKSNMLYWHADKRRNRIDYDQSNISYISYDNFLLNNKVSQEAVTERKIKTAQTENKLIKVINALEVVKQAKGNLEKIKNKLTSNIEDKKKRCLEASTDAYLSVYRKKQFSMEISKLKKNVGILKYTYITSSVEIQVSNNCK